MSGFELRIVVNWRYEEGIVTTPLADMGYGGELEYVFCFADFDDLVVV